MMAWNRLRDPRFVTLPLLLVAGMVLAISPAYAATVLDPNFSIEVYTTGVPAPSGLAFAPPTSAFGSHLYVSSAPFAGAPTGGEFLPDEIYKTRCMATSFHAS